MDEFKVELKSDDALDLLVNALTAIKDLSEKWESQAINLETVIQTSDLEVWIIQSNINRIRSMKREMLSVLNNSVAVVVEKDEE